MLHPTVAAQLHDNPADLAAWAEVRALVERALAGLPDAERQAFVAWAVEGDGGATPADDRAESARVALRDRLEPVLGELVEEG